MSQREQVFHNVPHALLVVAHDGVQRQRVDALVDDDQRELFHVEHIQQIEVFAVGAGVVNQPRRAPLANLHQALANIPFPVGQAVDVHHVPGRP